VVDVVGKVASPGVVELPAAARIRDAIAAAGGALPGTDLTALDLASRLSDGEQIFVGIPPPTGAAAQAAGGVVGGGVVGGPVAGGGDGESASGAAGAASVGVLDLNAATVGDLETLPGVGPVLAQHIVDWRSQHGRFSSVSQLQQVSGIGPSKYAALAGRVRV
jgi:competence protein ComEA